MTNLLAETLKVLEANGKKQSEILWCGSKEYGWFSWERFKALAKDLEYDAGYGGQEIANDLIVVAATWWLERHEYDGSEWWALKEMPKKPNKHCSPERLSANGHRWGSLEDVNKEQLP